MNLLTLGYAFVGGILPSLIWLYFLLKEDSRCPEPKKLIALTFAGGMLAVPLVLPIEQAAADHFGSATTTVLIAWALIEELAKYALAALLILWRKSVDESVDYVIYMVTVALGFAALENALFLFGPFSHGQLYAGLETGNLRFMGSTLVHVLSSSCIGFAMAFSYRSTYGRRITAAALGLILAVTLHASFNFLILSAGGAHTLEAFFTIWTGAIVFFALFEILKYSRYGRTKRNVC